MMPADGSRRKRGREQARGVRFLSRYPVLLVVPMSALFLGLGYAYAARLAGSWSYIHGAKSAAVFAGVALGVGLVTVGVIGARQGAGPWLFVPGVVVIASIVVTRQQIAPAVGSAGKITTGFEAAVFALLSVVWCGWPSADPNAACTSPGPRTGAQRPPRRFRSLSGGISLSPVITWPPLIRWPKIRA